MIQVAGVRSGNVAIREPGNGERLTPSVRPAETNLITDPQQAMGFAALAVDLHLAALARALRFRSRAVQTRHVQPDVEPDATRFIIHRVNLLRWRRLGSAYGVVANDDTSNKLFEIYDNRTAFSTVIAFERWH